VPGRRRRAFSPLRNATVALFSAGVIALLVLYAIAAPSVSMSAGVGQIVPLPGRTAVIVGRVLASGGGGLKGAHIAVRSASGLTRTASSDAAGAFRVALPGRCALYSVAIRASADGSNVSATVRHRLCPGDALPVDARVVTQGQFLWVPGPR
jgi:hypothetical protein